MKQYSNQNAKLLNIDDFLRIIGEFGRFHWILEMMFAFMFMVPALHMYIILFAVTEPDWKCVERSSQCYLNGTQPSTNDFRCNISRSEWEFVQEVGTKTVTVDFNLYCGSSWLIHMTSSAFYLGRAFGTFALGWLTDSFGRKRILFPSYAFTIFAELLLLVMPNIWLFLVFRFISGFFIAGIWNNILLLISEFVSTRYRPFANNVIWMVWIGGLCALSLQAYYIRDWKILFLVCSTPYLLGLLSFWFIPESPRWLRAKGRMDEAQEVFKRIARWNGKKLDNKSELSRPDRTNQQRTSLLLLFKKDMIVSTLAQCILWFVNGFAYYALSLTAGELGGSIYLNFVFLSIAEIPATLFLTYLPNRFGRKKTVIVSSFFAGIFCIAVGLIPLIDSRPILRVAFGIIGKFFCTLSLDIIYVWSFELFPTNIRSKGLSLVYMAFNIGSVASPWIAQGLKVYSEHLSFLIMGGSALFGALAGLALEETKGKDAKDTLEEVIRNKDFVIQFKNTDS